MIIDSEGREIKLLSEYLKGTVFFLTPPFSPLLREKLLARSSPMLLKLFMHLSNTQALSVIVVL